MAVFAAAVRWGTFAAGGSDSYCYVYQAERWASGRLQVVEPLALEAPWPDPPLTFAPAGHIPSPTVRGAAVPMCPAGLSIAMAPLAYVGAAFRRPDALFAVVPLFGTLLVWSVYALGARFSPRVGLASALLAACSPAFLFQLMQPMSDVPAAALWVLATVQATSRRPRAPLTAGLATSAAILVRPNLLPMGMVLGVYFLVGSDPDDGATQEVESPR
ncbi:MAG TPA: glycosyltransferase family 39 protein, partial [Vicinamibacterales bacterium]